MKLQRYIYEFDYLETRSYTRYEYVNLLWRWCKTNCLKPFPSLRRIPILLDVIPISVLRSSNTVQNWKILISHVFHFNIRHINVTTENSLIHLYPRMDSPELLVVYILEMWEKRQNELWHVRVYLSIIPGDLKANHDHCSHFLDVQ